MRKKAIMTYIPENKTLSYFLKDISNLGTELIEKYNNQIEFRYIPVIYNRKPAVKIIIEDKNENILENVIDDFFKKTGIPNLVNNNSDFITIERVLSLYYKKLKRGREGLFIEKKVVDIKTKF
jgi:hypothetical protein